MVKNNVYVGQRYVPEIIGEWNNSTDYEGLSIVTYQGTSYTSKKRVPVGIDIGNEDFWVVTGNYNSQVENYRQEVEEVAIEVDKQKNDISYLNDYSTGTINAKFPPSSLVGLTGDGIADETVKLQSIIDYAASFNPAKEVLIPSGVYNINGEIELKSPIDCRGRLDVYSGKIILNRAGLTHNRLNVNVQNLNIEHEIVRVASPHITIKEIRVTYDAQYTVEPEYTSILIEAIDPKILVWDVKILSFYISVCGVGIDLKNNQGLTDISLLNGTIRSYNSYGIKMSNDYLSPMGSLGYCVLDNIVFQNVSPIVKTKTAVHFEGLGNTLNNIKIFNDANANGRHIAVSSKDDKLTKLITDKNTIEIANHITGRTASTLSNVRAEGEIDLGYLRDSIILLNVNNYQTATTYNGYTQPYQYGKDALKHKFKMSDVVVSSPDSITPTVTKDDTIVKVTVPSTGRFIVSFKIPDIMINSLNRNKKITASLVTNSFRLPNTGCWLGIVKGVSDFTYMENINQNNGIRTNKSIVTLMSALSPTVTLTNNNSLSFLVIGAEPDNTYEFYFSEIWSGLVNFTEEINAYANLIPNT